MNLLIALAYTGTIFTGSFNTTPFPEPKEIPPVSAPAEVNGGGTPSPYIYDQNWGLNMSEMPIVPCQSVLGCVDIENTDYYKDLMKFAAQELKNNGNLSQFPSMNKWLYVQS